MLGVDTCVVLPFYVYFQLKEKSQACGGNLGSIEELRGAIYLAEEACPGISDTMVAQLVQRLQR
jgi:serine/threonine-protein kinase 24/25/MST4